MPQIQAGETFVVGQQFTATRANNHVNGAILLPGAVGDQIAASPPMGGFDLTNIEILGRDVTLNQLRKYTFPDIFSQINGTSFSVFTSGPINLETTGPLMISSTFLGQIGDLATPGFIFQWAGGGGTIEAPGGFSFFNGTNVDITGDLTVSNDVNVAGDINLGTTGKIGYENPPGTFIDVTDKLKTGGVLKQVVEEVISPYNNASLPASWTTTFTSSSYTKPSNETWVIEIDCDYTHGANAHNAIRLTQTSNSQVFFVAFSQPYGGVTANVQNLSRRFVIPSGTTFTSTFVIQSQASVAGYTFNLGKYTYPNSGYFSTVVMPDSKFRIYKYLTA